MKQFEVTKPKQYRPKPIKPKKENQNKQQKNNQPFSPSKNTHIQTFFARPKTQYEAIKPIQYKPKPIKRKGKEKILEKIVVMKIFTFYYDFVSR